MQKICFLLFCIILYIVVYILQKYFNVIYLNLSATKDDEFWWVYGCMFVGGNWTFCSTPFSGMEKLGEAQFRVRTWPLSFFCFLFYLFCRNINKHIRQYASRKDPSVSAMIDVIWYYDRFNHFHCFHILQGSINWCNRFPTRTFSCNPLDMTFFESTLQCIVVNHWYLLFRIYTLSTASASWF